MLDEDFETIIPTSFPAEGFEFHEPNYKDIAPRLGATYRLSEKTVLRAGYGIYYNPNQMNSFTFLTNNPPMAAVATFSSDPANPTLSFEQPVRRRRARSAPPDMISPTRDLPNARKDQWSFDLQRELWRGHRAGPAVRRLEHRATWIAASSTTRRSPGRGRSIRGGRASASARAASSRTT